MPRVTPIEKPLSTDAVICLSKPKFHGDGICVTLYTMKVVGATSSTQKCSPYECKCDPNKKIQISSERREKL